MASSRLTQRHTSAKSRGANTRYQCTRQDDTAPEDGCGCGMEPPVERLLVVVVVRLLVVVVAVRLLVVVVSLLDNAVLLIVMVCIQ